MTSPGTPQVAQIACCNPVPLTRYINVELFGRMLTYGAIVAGGLGFWRYDMIKRERAARIAAENRAIAIQHQADAERQTLLATLDEERQQAAAERERLMAIVTGLMEQVNLLVQQHNGNHARKAHSPTEH